ncbi:MAG: hypothetical protein ACYS47_19135 [Planctomycetota bacterium]|jgi:chemotaxis protein histidine kinase CheA
MAEEDGPRTVESLLATFIADAGDHLEMATLHLLNLEAELNDEESFNDFSRAIHCIHRKARGLGLIQIHVLTHEILTLLDSVPHGKPEHQRTVVELAFETVEAIGRLLANVADSISTGYRIPSEPWIKELVLKIQSLGGCELSSIETSPQREGS